MCVCCECGICGVSRVLQVMPWGGREEEHTQFEKQTNTRKCKYQEQELATVYVAVDVGDVVEHSLQLTMAMVYVAVVSG